jgi:hypothetical protein
MACLINRDAGGEITSVNSIGRGTPSPLYTKIKNNIDSNKENALLMWGTIFTEPFKNWFGDWVAKIGGAKVRVGKLNSHGEPQLYKSNNQWVFKKNNGQEFPLLYNPKSELANRKRRIQVSNDNALASLKTVLGHLRTVFPDINLEIVNQPNNTKAGWAKDDTVYINLARANKETAFHEFGHPFIRAIKVENPKVYEGLVKTTEVSSDVRERNPHLSEEDLIEEQIVDDLGRITAFKLGRATFMKKLIEYIQSTLNALISALRGSQTYLRPDSLGFMTLEDLSDIMLGNKSVFIDTNTLTGLEFNQETVPDHLVKLEDISTEQGGVYDSSDDTITFADNIVPSIGDFRKDNFKVRYQGEDYSPAEYAALKEFGNVDPETGTIFDAAQGTEINFDQAVDKHRQLLEATTLYNKMINMWIMAEMNVNAKDNLGLTTFQSKFNRLHDKYRRLTGRDIRKQVFEDLRKALPEAMTELGIQKYIGAVAEDNPYKEGTEHRIKEDVVLKSDVFGIGSHFEGILQNRVGELTLLDFKTSNTMKGLDSTRILRFGANWGLTDSKISRAKLEMMIKAFMVRENLPDAKFERIAVPYINNNTGINIYNVDVNAYLGTLGKYLESVKTPEEMKEIRQRGLLNPNSYVGQDTVVNQFQDQLRGMDLSQKNVWVHARLSAIHSKYSDEDLNKPKMAALKKQSQQLAKLALELNKETGMQLEVGHELRADSDMTMYERLTDNFSKVKNPLIKTFVKLWRNKKDIMEKRMRAVRHENDKMFKPVLDEYLKRKGIPNVGINNVLGMGLKTKELYAFLWATNPNKEGQFMNLANTYYDPISKSTRHMSTAQILYRDHIRKNMHIEYATVANTTVTTENGDQIPMYSYLKKPSNLNEDFAPRMPQTLGDIQESDWLPIKATARHMFYKYFTTFFEQNFQKLDTFEGGVRTKYLIEDDSSIITSGNHSLNMQHGYLEFMNNMIRKQEMDELYSLSKGIKGYLQAKTDTKGSLMYKNTVQFFDDQVMLQVLDQRFREDDLKRKIEFNVDEDSWWAKHGILNPGINEVNYTKAVYMMKAWTTMTAMMLKAGAGAANGALIISLNALEAVKNEMVLIAGGDESKVDLRMKDMLAFNAAYFSSYLPAVWSGKADSNKMWGMAKQINYIADNFDYKVNSSELLGARNPLVDSGHLYMLHTMFENYGSLMTMYMQMKARKVGDTNMWDAYKLNEQNGEYEYTGPSRGRIQDPDGTYRDLLGFEPREIAHMKKIHERIHGSYRSEEKMAIELEIWGQFVVQFKKFLPEMINNLWMKRSLSESLGDWVPQLDKDGNIEQNEGMDVYTWQERVQQGRFLLMANVAGAYLGRNSDRFREGYRSDVYLWENLSQEEKAQFSHMLATTAMAVLLYVMSHAIPEDDEDKYYAKRWNRLMYEDITQGANPIDLFRFIEKPIPAAGKALKFLTAVSSWLTEGIWNGEITREGAVKGKKALINSLPVLSGLRQTQMIFDEYNDEETDFLDVLR